MRFVVVAVVLALLSVQAHAQMGKQQGGGAAADPKDVDRQKRMAKEEADAKAAMKNVPDSKEKYDPWKIAK